MFGRSKATAIAPGVLVVDARGRARAAPRWRLMAGMRRKLAALVVVPVLTMGVGQMVGAQIEPGSVPTAAVDPAALPFENAATNFPGSAFYYLDADEETAVIASPETAPDGADASVSADPFRSGGSTTDRARARQCLTAAIYYEAALEPDAGQQAVAQVVLNRVAHPSYPDTVCGVVYQGSERRTGCQFTFTCDGSLARAPSAFYWRRAMKVAERALAGHVYAPARLATHYHTTEVSPYWAPSLHFLATIGAHRFYSWRGSAGMKSAFYRPYRGGEPLPQPKPRRADPVDEPVADPIQLARAFERERAAAEAASLQAAEAARLGQPVRAVAPAATPGYSAPRYSDEAIRRGGEDAFGGERLPDTGGVRPEYRDSGRWIGKPTG